MRNCVALACLVAIFGLALMASNTEACSCMPAHPQSQYCNAEYVIIARVVRKYMKSKNEIGYKINIKKEYKMTDKARTDLKHGRVHTSLFDSMCGVKLEVNKVYVIMGNSPRLSLCNFIKKYSEMTIVAKRGVAGGFKKGCSCDVMPCFREGQCELYEGECLWNPTSDCETHYGSCIPSRSTLNAEGKPVKCHWRRSTPYLTCRSRKVYYEP